MAHEDPTDIPTIKIANWAKSLEQMALWISSHQGISKGSLAYILCHDEGVPLNPDPKHGDADSVYSTHEEEICARNPHTLLGRVTYTDHYKSDNESVWKLIVKWCKDHPSWTVARPHQKKRMAGVHIMLYTSHFLGPCWQPYV